MYHFNPIKSCSDFFSKSFECPKVGTLETMGPFETLTAKLTDDVLCHIGRFFPRVVLFVTLSGVLLVTSNLGDQGRSRMEEAWNSNISD